MAAMPGKRAWGLLRAVALAAAVAVTLACGIGTGTGGSGDPAPPAATGSGTEVDGTKTAAEFERDIRGAVGLAEHYWAAQFTASRQRFQPVQRVIAYEQDGEVTCGGAALTRNNAAYCAAGDFIAYDVNWAAAAFQKIGDAFLYYLLGHEYAHGIQIRLGATYDYTIQQELQADCMAGAYIGDSVKAGSLDLQEGDLEELREGLLAVGDDPGQPWFAPGAHGTAEERTDSFFAGYERSLSACGLS